MERKEEKYRRTAVLGTILVHALILVGLFFLSLTTPLPLPGEEGVMVDLGYSEQGMGDIQPLTPPPAANPEESIPETAPEEQTVTQEEESVALPEKPKEKPRAKPQPAAEKEQEKPKEPVVDPRALYPGRQEGTSGEGSQGSTGQPGDQGKPDGTPGSGNYDGSGAGGGGVSFSLGGRSAELLPKPSATFTETGTVVVEIWVDRYGKVTRAVAGYRGTTTTSTVLRKLAENAALKARFNAQMDAPETQKGTITYHFLIKN